MNLKKNLKKKVFFKSLFILFPNILACERYNSAVQPFTGGLWECKNCAEQQLEQICKSVSIRNYFSNFCAVTDALFRSII